MRAPAFPVSESGRGVQANLAAIAESRRRGPRISCASLRPQRARCACHDETCACVGIASRGPSEQNESAPPPQRGHRADMLYRLLGTTSGHSGYSLWVQGNHMVDNSTIVAGIEIPSSDPLFLTVVIAIHIPL